MTAATERALALVERGKTTEGQAEFLNADPEAEELEPAPAQPNPFLGYFDDSIMTTGFLEKLEIPRKKKLLGDFFEEGDFGFIYAPRGLGKTWLSMSVADSIARGRACGEWEAGKMTSKVLVVDGEMSLSDSKERSRALGLSPKIHWLHHERLFTETEKTLNLTDPDQQDALFTYCKALEIDCIVLDNLSCLFYGLKENDADDWGEYVLPWILRLRRQGISAIMVAHAGRNGLMRGTSKREDQAHWVLKLSPAPSASADDAEGARFVSKFTKNRHSPESRSPQLLWEFVPQDDGTTSVVCQKHTGYEAFLELVRDGVESNKDIADELEVRCGTVSKWTRKAVEAKRVEKEGNKLKWIGDR